jgi:hypothetical protein
VGDFTAGSTCRFEVHNWSQELGLAGGSSYFGVLISASAGDFALPLGDGRNTGLAADGFLKTSLALIPGPLSGLITAGMGSTSEFTFPGAGDIPPGTTLHCVGVGYELSPTASFSKLTDIVEVQVQ